MQEITISLEERNVLREFARNFGGTLGDLQVFVEEGADVEEGAKGGSTQQQNVELLFSGLDAIGWRLDSDQEAYRLQGESDTLEFLRLCRDQANEFDDDEQADETVAVCDAILGCFEAVAA
jgi:hypothetical protein